MAQHEVLAGTAPQARGWLLLHSAGAWGARAVEAQVHHSIISWANSHDYKILLVRRHDTKPTGNVQYWLSQGSESLVTGFLDSPSSPPNLATSVPAAPLIVICTNGSRDQCCAIDGIKLRKELSRELDSAELANVWEGTHIGGHRFAPTVLSLPGNLLLGRVSTESIISLIRNGKVPWKYVRGRTHTPPCYQVLEANISDFSTIVWDDWPASCPSTDHVHRGIRETGLISFKMRSSSKLIRPESCGSSGVEIRQLIYVKENNGS